MLTTSRESGGGGGGSVDISSLATATALSALETKIDTVDTVVDTLTTTLATVHGKVDTVDTVVDTHATNLTTVHGKIDTIDTLVDALTTTLSTVNGKIDTVDTVVDTINGNNPGGGGGGYGVKYKGTGQVSGTCPSGKTWIAIGNGYSNGGAGWGPCFAVKTAGSSSFSSVGVNTSFYFNQGPWWAYTLEYDNA